MFCFFQCLRCVYQGFIYYRTIALISTIMHGLIIVSISIVEITFIGWSAAHRQSLSFNLHQLRIRILPRSTSPRNTLNTLWAIFKWRSSAQFSCWLINWSIDQPLQARFNNRSTALGTTQLERALLSSPAFTSIGCPLRLR